MITVSGDNDPKEETHVNSKSLECPKILTKIGYYMLGSTSFSPSLIPKHVEEGRASAIDNLGCH